MTSGAGATGGLRDLGYRLSGSSDLYADDGRRPFSSVNFITAHDGFTLRDLTTYEHKHNEANGEDNRDGTDNNRSWNHGVEGETDDPTIRDERRRTLRSMLATLLLSTGVPMLTAGDEMGRTQGGSNNAYCQDNEVSWLDWALDPWQVDLLEFARLLLAIRRDHPALRHRHFFEGRSMTEGGAKDLAWFGPTGTELVDGDWWEPYARTLGMYVGGDSLRSQTPRGEPIVDSSFLLLLHAGSEPVGFLLPGAPWAATYRSLLDTADERPSPSPTPLEPGDLVGLAPRSLILLEAFRPEPGSP